MHRMVLNESTIVPVRVSRELADKIREPVDAGVFSESERLYGCVGSLHDHKLRGVAENFLSNPI